MVSFLCSEKRKEPGGRGQLLGAPPTRNPDNEARRNNNKNKKLQIKIILNKKQPRPITRRGSTKMVAARSRRRNGEEKTPEVKALMPRQEVIDSPPKTPFIMGSEWAGDIKVAGKGVENLKIGVRIIDLLNRKAWSELIVVPANSVYAQRARTRYSDAATITTNYTVVHILLFKVVCITPGKTLLIHTAGGSMGQAVVQLPKMAYIQHYNLWGLQHIEIR